MAKQIIHSSLTTSMAATPTRRSNSGSTAFSTRSTCRRRTPINCASYLAPYVGAGTKVGRGGVVVGGRAAAARSRGGAAADRDQNKAIRELGQRKGYQISAAAASRRRSSTSTTRRPAADGTG